MFAGTPRDMSLITFQVHAGVKLAKKDQDDTKVFAEAEAWLAPRR